MAIISSKDTAFIPQKMKVMLLPLGLLSAMVILVIVIFKVGIGRISTQRVEFQKATKNETILSQKQQVLQTIESNILSYADTAIIAMPDKNPSLVALSQLKNLAEKSALNIGSIEIGGETKGKSGPSKTTISFEVEGTLSQVLNYLISTESFAPLSVIDRVEIAQAGGVIRASVDLAVFWAPLPTKLPAISEPVQELSAGETGLITELSGLEQPLFTQILPAAPSARIDPFAY
ncbi:hypothetical protein KKH23_01120 [Patescibacteria group bacterium]|nr:hypothetical protein [Patescibacteria group bacterium]MBU0777092.1 hypothetical protein [Patescibacteria group bacterium]MBU0845786.1 hypothetical protein [Patescibacteria group bacterium]MBU0922813.1 hypothetical protein [Patescibacteria group bacterium]MBU1066454.1 hypothetical protein [Patescibacteria group bacterium]